MQRPSPRGKLLLSLASRADFSRAYSVVRKIYTSLPIIMYQTAVHAAYMARSLSKKLQVHIPVMSVCILSIIHGASLLANLHITTVGHGYNSYIHVDHNRMYHHLSCPVRHVMFHSHEPFTRHHRIFLWQTFPGDYPTP